MFFSPLVNFSLRPLLGRRPLLLVGGACMAVGLLLLALCQSGSAGSCHIVYFFSSSVDSSGGPEMDILGAFLKGWRVLWFLAFRRNVPMYEKVTPCLRRVFHVCYALIHVHSLQPEQQQRRLQRLLVSSSSWWHMRSGVMCLGNSLSCSTRTFL